MGLPVILYETDVHIEKEDYVHEVFENLVHSSAFEIDNSYNTESHPIIGITFNNDIDGIKLINTTTNVEVVCEYPFLAGESIQIEDGGIYKDGIELDCIYTGILKIKENSVNEFKIEISPVNDTSVNIDLFSIKAIGSSEILAHLESFKWSKKSNLIPNTIGLNKKIGKYILNDYNYQFSINKLWDDNYFFEIDDECTYRLRFEINDTAIGVQPQNFYLCGCKFEDYDLSGGRDVKYSESISGYFNSIFNQIK